MTYPIHRMWPLSSQVCLNRHYAFAFRSLVSNYFINFNVDNTDAPPLTSSKRSVRLSGQSCSGAIPDLTACGLAYATSAVIRKDLLRAQGMAFLFLSFKTVVVKSERGLKEQYQNGWRSGRLPTKAGLKNIQTYGAIVVLEQDPLLSQCLYKATCSTPPM